MMELTQALVRTAALAVRGSLRFEYQGREVDLEAEWPRRTMLELVSEAVGPGSPLDRPALADLARIRGLEVEPTWGPGKLVYQLYEKLVEDELWGPVLVCDVPREGSPPARPPRDDPGGRAERPRRDRVPAPPPRLVSPAALGLVLGAAVLHAGWNVLLHT